MTDEGLSDGSRLDTALLDAFPKVRLDADNAAFYRGLLREQVVMNRCADCSWWHHPPRSVCPKCWSRQIEPTEVGGEGVIVFRTVLRQGRREAGADYSDGYVVVAVEFDEQPGLRLTGTVVGTPADAVALGQRVRAIWRAIDGRSPRPDFEVIR